MEYIGVASKNEMTFPEEPELDPKQCRDRIRLLFKSDYHMPYRGPVGKYCNEILLLPNSDYKKVYSTLPMFVIWMNDNIDEFREQKSKAA
jgi:hypothetical protein